MNNLANEHDRIRRGIAAHSRRCAALKRWIRMAGELPASRFDAAFVGRSGLSVRRGKSGVVRDPMVRLAPIGGDTFLLGDMTGSERSFNIDLLQHMCRIGDVETKVENGEVVYFLPSKDCSKKQ